MYLSSLNFNQSVRQRVVIEINWETREMMDINISDVTLHIDNNLDETLRSAVEKELRSLKGVISVHMPTDKPHLVAVAYNPMDVKATHIEHSIRELAGHVEMIGL